MADIEREVISKVLAEATLSELLDRRITEEFFEDDKNAEVFEFIHSHWTKYGKVPDLVTFKASFPSLRLPDVPEPLEYYLDGLQEQRRYQTLLEGIASTKRHLEDGDLDEVTSILNTTLSQANQEGSVSRDVNAAETMIGDLVEYKSKKDRELLGLSTGFTVIDYATLGIQSEQFILIAGPQGSGKSTIAQKIAVNIFNLERAVLYIGFEQSTDELKARFHSMSAKVSHRRLVLGKLTTDEEKRYVRNAKAISDGEFIIVGDPSGTVTLSGIASKIEQYDPEFVVVDGIYLMMDEEGERNGSSQALTNITRGIKRLCQRFKAPILGTTQTLESKTTKSAGTTIQSIGYTSSFAQDADVVMGVQPDPEDPEIIKLRGMKVRGGRKGWEAAIEFNWDTCAFEELGIEEGSDDADEDSNTSRRSY